MKYLIIFLALIFGTVFQAEAKEKNTNHKKKRLHYLDGRLSPKDKRYKTFMAAINLLNQRQAQTIVETGTARFGSSNFEGDGGSSIIFSDWANDHAATFYSVDINQDYINDAYEAVQKTIPNIKTPLFFICSDSIEFLRNFGQSIDFLYLDSYDFDVNDPLPSQQHHLEELKASYRWLHEDSVIMIDDCNLPFGGKGKLAIEFLTKRGWKMLRNEYQVILVRN
ncbi:MAG: class I SAM-dependent methyltransferase [Chlamydiae bacterium]|nr:class I SAM-dependent methyltransferase [Chlamydiota bacterium]